MWKPLYPMVILVALAEANRKAQKYKNIVEKARGDPETDGFNGTVCSVEYSATKEQISGDIDVHYVPYFFYCPRPFDSPNATNCCEHIGAICCDDKEMKQDQKRVFMLAIAGLANLVMLIVCCCRFCTGCSWKKRVQRQDEEKERKLFEERNPVKKTFKPDEPRQPKEPRQDQPQPEDQAQPEQQQQQQQGQQIPMQTYYPSGPMQPGVMIMQPGTQQGYVMPQQGYQPYQPYPAQGAGYQYVPYPMGQQVQPGQAPYPPATSSNETAAPLMNQP